MRSRRLVHAVVLDMDNTLYDWVAYFVPAIEAMVTTAARLLDVDEDHLRDDLRSVHVLRRNTEHPFALLETDTVRTCLPEQTREARHDTLLPAFVAFNETRRDRLRLYPGVRDTLTTIRGAGCRIFGHTEATAVNISSRVRQLGLHEVLEAIYAPLFTGQPHPLGDGPRESVEKVPVRPLPADARKPDPATARLILSEIGVAPERCLYVGDSLDKDMTMAKQVGMLAAWARYGTRHDPSQWRALVRISHWDAPTPADGTRDAEPDVILDSFPELLDHFRWSSAG